MFNKVTALAASAAVLALISTSPVDAASVTAGGLYNSTSQQWSGNASYNSNLGVINWEVEGTAGNDDSNLLVDSAAVKAGVPFTVGGYFNILPRAELGWGRTTNGIDSGFWGGEVKSQQTTFVIPKLDTVIGYRYRQNFASDIDFNTQRFEAGLVYHVNDTSDIGASYYRTKWSVASTPDYSTNSFGLNYTVKF